MVDCRAPLQVCLLVLATFCMVECNRLVYQFEKTVLEKDSSDLLAILKKASYIQRKYYGETEVKVNGFSWQDCGTKTSAVHINSASLTPDPLSLPGNADVAFDVTFSAPVVAPLKAELTIEKKEFGIWLKIPCIKNIGSCTYNDVCSMIPAPPGGQCPPPFGTYKIPCKCPFKPGRYKLPSYKVYIDDSKIPSALVDGDFSMKAQISTNGREVGCVTGTLTIASRKSRKNSINF